MHILFTTELNLRHWCAIPSAIACWFVFLLVFFSLRNWLKGKMSFIGVRLHNSWPAFPTALPYFVERMRSCCWRGEVGKQGASISHTTKIELLGAWCPCLHSDGSAVLLACVCVFDRDGGLLKMLYSLDVCLFPHLQDCCSQCTSET